MYFVSWPQLHDIKKLKTKGSNFVSAALDIKVDKLTEWSIIRKILPDKFGFITDILN